MFFFRKNNSIQVTMQDSSFLMFILTYSNDLFVCSRSVVGPSPSNPIDPAATPCDIKTVIFLYLMYLYVFVFCIYITWLHQLYLLAQLTFISRTIFRNYQTHWNLNRALKVGICIKQFVSQRLIMSFIFVQTTIQTTIVNGFTFK